ncbi:hypothetical protein TNCV_967031 [Trichonephila clavipes]|nr:hypothetical protein TNCV_967031 [Trichonephila clavipes]
MTSRTFERLDDRDSTSAHSSRQNNKYYADSKTETGQRVSSQTIRNGIHAGGRMHIDQWCAFDDSWTSCNLKKLGC